MENWDVVILGGGAAGLMCAIECARRGRRVVVLEHRKSPGEKIRISGGGRCNFTNLEIAPERFICQNPHFARGFLSRYSQWDFIDRVAGHGIAYHEKTLGQLFCDGSAQEIIDMLLGDLRTAGSVLRLGCAVEGVTQAQKGYNVATSQGVLAAGSVVVATGGKSIPKIGASDIGYRIARDFDLPMVETRPGLVPLTFDGPLRQAMRALSGLSVQARVGCGGAGFTEGLLYTHRGLSGPSILQISSYWREGQSLSVDLCDGSDFAEALQAQRQSSGARSVARALDAVLPRRLSDVVAAELGMADTRIADLSRAQIDRLVGGVKNWQVVPTGSEGYRTAEVTLGGVDTDALDPRTCASRAHPGLYFIGEVVDVTGWLGGYNFQWAWSSGWAAGQVA